MSRLSISRAWDETTSFIGRESRLLVPVALAFFAAAPTIASWIEPGGLMAPTAKPQLMVLLLLIILLLSFVGQLTIASLAIGQTGSVGETIGLAFRRVWGVLASLFLVMFPIMLVAIFATGSALTSAGLTDPGSITPEALAEVPGIAPILLGCVLLLLSCWARFYPVSAVAMKESGNPLKLIPRSWRLTRGCFWRLLATVLLILIAETVLTQTLTFVGGSLFALALGKIEPFSASALLVALLVSLAGAAVSVVSAVLIGRVYAQLSTGQAGVPEVKRES